MSHQLLDSSASALADPADAAIEIPDAPPLERTEQREVGEQHARTGEEALDDRAAFQRRCERLAGRLDSAETLPDRTAIYTGKTYRELSTASALCPDLMPLLNGEFEWIVLQSADVLD